MSTNVQQQVNIGARVYIAMPTKCIVVPAVVIEKITRETEQGIRTTCILDFGAPGKNRIPSDTLDDALIVMSLDDARGVLMDAMRAQVDAAISTAAMKGDQRFGQLSKNSTSM
jgi:diphthamide biosynthesis methyltransferase